MFSFHYKNRILASGLLFALIPANWAVAFDTPLTKEFVLFEYSKALSELEEPFKHCNGEAIYNRSEMGEGENVRLTNSSKVEFAFSGPNGMIQETVNSADMTTPSPIPSQAKQKSARDYQFVLNFQPKYSFMLTKKTQDANFLIRWIENGPAVAEKAITRRIGQFIRCPMTADAFPVSKLFGIAGFQIVKVTAIEEVAQPRRIRIDFTIPKRVNAKPNALQITSGWLVVTPEARWALLEYGIVFTSSRSTKTTRVGHIEYDPGSTGIPKPVSIQHCLYVGEFSNDPALSVPPVLPRVMEDFRFTNLRFGDRPDRDFTLSAYGLPEFGQTVAQASASRRYPWWILGSAIALTVFAFLLRRLSSRSPAAPGKDQPAS